jgi:hypothetical protein
MSNIILSSLDEEAGYSSDLFADKNLPINIIMPLARIFDCFIYYLCLAYLKNCPFGMYFISL